MVEIIPAEQYSGVLEEISKKIAAENKSDALNLDGEVTEYSDLKTDYETEVEANPVYEVYSDSNLTKMIESSIHSTSNLILPKKI
ncbi:hypothetical protein AVEN_125163-1 [Araneus ventricosus]|uniref:Uncharacterized protein n=1 Tax=Araneus ventricosus TaxID=182803 RepID=A0A4Y2LW96_ARAVE|nr:hypothetical protein AVEN_125163-1 [Araneus ventricosus]